MAVGGAVTSMHLSFILNADQYWTAIQSYKDSCHEVRRANDVYPHRIGSTGFRHPHVRVRCVRFRHRDCSAGFAHGAGNSQDLPLPGTAIYEITSKDHFALRISKNTIDLGVLELVQQSMQSVSMTVNVTNEIVSLASHELASSFSTGT
jgi:hypothetical protein